MRDSSDLHSNLSDVDIQWSPERNEAALLGLHRKKRRRQQLRRGSALLVLVIVGFGSYQLTQSAEPRSEAIVIAVDPNPLKHRLVDRSIISRRDPSSQYEVLEDTSEGSVLRLTAGTIDIDRSAASSAAGQMVVLSHEVRIIVYAPALWASHSARATIVSPLRGHLEVHIAGAVEKVAAGEQAEFPIAGVPDPTPGPSDATEAEAVAAPRSIKASREPAKQGPGGIADRVKDLMLAADAARMSGHPEDALAPLNRVLRGHSSDPQAPLAAFTLGKILLDELGKPAAAVRAFRTAYRLGPEGALAEDALAREVEALSRAGEMGKARTRAREYLEHYPRGHRSKSVKQYAEL